MEEEHIGVKVDDTGIRSETPEEQLEPLAGAKLDNAKKGQRKFQEKEKEVRRERGRKKRRKQ